jgi:aminocarboxymuconate-semialdehyde decarboxylase
MFSDRFLPAPVTRRRPRVRIVDSHFHWWPRSIFEALCERTGYPRAERDGKGGYIYYRAAGVQSYLPVWAEWFDLDKQLEHMDALGHHVDAFGSIGPFSVHFSDLPPEEGRDAAIQWNEEMAGMQRSHPGRFWASAAVPLVDTDIALDVLNHAIGNLGLKGVNLPGSVGSDPRIDHERLEPFYDRVEELGLPLFLHPTDAVFADMLSDGYGGALHLSLGRVIEVSVAAMRLVFSGIMERHPNLKLVMSHTGGALPYQAGRMDKNGKKANLPELPSTYLKRMYTDTVSPHALGMKFAVEFFGPDHVMYGSDYPCWSPAAALEFFEEAGFSQDVQQKILSGNARRILQLDTPALVTA